MLEVYKFLKSVTLKVPLHDGVVEIYCQYLYNIINYDYIFVSLYGGPFCYFFPWGGLYATLYFLSGAFFIVWRPFCYVSLHGGPFCHVFLLVWGLFHNVGAFLAIFFSMWEDFFVFIRDFMSLCFFMGLPLPSMIYFAGACYYVTFIP